MPYRVLIMPGLFWLTMIGIVEFKNKNSPSYKGLERIDGKTAIVTGANSGLGREVATELAARGAKVYMACRDLTKCEEARKGILYETETEDGSPTLICRHCDLASLHSVRAFAHKFNKEEPYLHILVNNAGVMGSPKTVTEDGFELQWATNFVGHFVLTTMLLDKMKTTGPSRIINVTSLTHANGKINFDDINGDEKYEPLVAYNQSKLANILFSRELARRLRDWCVTTYCVSPGFAYTNIWRNTNFKQNRILEKVLRPLMALALRTPRQGAQTAIYCCLAPELEKSSGQYYDNCAQSEPAETALDDELAKELWTAAERWTTPKTKIV